MYNIGHVQKAIGYEFKSVELVTMALTHASYAYTHHTVSYDRLELLGDSVLSLVVSEYLYCNTPYSRNEGELSRIRAIIVSQPTLTEVITRLNILDEVLIMSEVDLRGKVPSDVLEALFGAVYLDGGLVAATALILSLMKKDIDAAASAEVPLDYKSRLQEAAQAKTRCAGSLITYEVEKSSENSVTVCVKFKNKIVSSAIGATKKIAEQLAAKLALEFLFVK